MASNTGAASSGAPQAGADPLIYDPPNTPPQDGGDAGQVAQDGVQAGPQQPQPDAPTPVAAAASGPATTSAPAGVAEPPGITVTTPTTPIRKPFIPEHIHYGSPLGTEMNADGDGSKTEADKLIHKMSEVILTMNKQIEMLTAKLDKMDDEKHQRENSDRLKEINFKDISKPSKYSGTGWSLWSRNFASFLERRDRRWSKLLQAISARSAGPPLNSDAKSMIAVDADIYTEGLM